MLRQALVDGVIHEEEEAFLKTVQIAFDIDEETHEQIAQSSNSCNPITPELEAYRSVLSTALIDGIITNDESAMLETLRRTGNQRSRTCDDARRITRCKEGIIMGMSDDDVKIHDALKKLERGLKNIKPSKVLLVGDIMMDCYIHGFANNLNSRAPVPVLKETSRDVDVRSCCTRRSWTRFTRIEKPSPWNRG